MVVMQPTNWAQLSQGSTRGAIVLIVTRYRVDAIGVLRVPNCNIMPRTSDSF